ncbi:MAG: hypothetical protein KDA53_07040 [Hyphomonas sp.]|nr:hypothetical protein [Hyphomonas sp.]
MDKNLRAFLIVFGGFFLVLLATGIGQSLGSIFPGMLFGAAWLWACVHFVKHDKPLPWERHGDDGDGAET